MKYLILLSFLLLPCLTYGQNTVYWTDTTGAQYKPDRAVSQEYPLPVRLYGTSTITATPSGIQMIADTTQYSIKPLQTTDTMSYLGIDSVALGGVQWSLPTLVSMDSSFSISTSRTFPVNETFVLGNLASFTYPKALNSKITPYLYYRPRYNNSTVKNIQFIIVRF